jgi:hypothetical protein
VRQHARCSCPTQATYEPPTTPALSPPIARSTRLPSDTHGARGRASCFRDGSLAALHGLTPYVRQPDPRVPPPTPLDSPALPLRGRASPPCRIPAPGPPGSPATATSLSPPGAEHQRPSSRPAAADQSPNRPSNPSLPKRPAARNDRPCGEAHRRFGIGDRPPVDLTGGGDPCRAVGLSAFFLFRRGLSASPRHSWPPCRRPALQVLEAWNPQCSRPFHNAGPPTPTVPA